MTLGGMEGISQYNINNSFLQQKAIWFRIIINPKPSKKLTEFASE